VLLGKEKNTISEFIFYTSPVNNISQKGRFVLTQFSPRKSIKKNGINLDSFTLSTVMRPYIKRENDHEN